MARRRYGRKRHASRRRKLPLLATAGLLVGMYNLAGSWKESKERAMISLTGYDKNYGWNWKWATTTVPIVLGCVGSYAMSKIGINKMLRDIPFIKL